MRKWVLCDQKPVKSGSLVVYRRTATKNLFLENTVLPRSRIETPQRTLRTHFPVGVEGVRCTGKGLQHTKWAVERRDAGIQGAVRRTKKGLNTI